MHRLILTDVIYFGLILSGSMILVAHSIIDMQHELQHEWGTHTHVNTHTHAHTNTHKKCPAMMWEI